MIFFQIVLIFKHVRVNEIILNITYVIKGRLLQRRIYQPLYWLTLTINIGIKYGVLVCVYTLSHRHTPPR